MHVRVNAATSVDGKLSTRERTQFAISGAEDFARVDELRADFDAVMVGVGTVLADDPSLTLKDAALATARESRGESPQPARVVADSQARTPTDASVLGPDADTYVLVSENAQQSRVRELERAGAHCVVAGNERVALPDALAKLEADGVERVMVEGGGELLFSLFADDLVDALSVFVGSMVVGGRDAPTLVDGDGFTDDFPRLSLTDADRLDDGVLLTYDVLGRDGGD
ncbi:2,5-diamino-6-(ribosylamino)-4(3H)-pyrimidinone 5'-phosphate reductase [Salarchaeum sp. JOR-1]|uniref:2,5-diamino-6-(ribosylamino)-4(3H)-pyrimidinone 5'-phosphate reductase n=1 Tax=Salarchaeum sp. JOR-1 TaxID=2599399 RepID=UPI0011985341|nr:2,5-diamino-6-(ribosylamino)-4(3H)-pyrimidinone 5'-phosphate reductase [Salarchaeum sp. JOR-1]QDX41568.1 2,5-diamino-6-(ribosylamino)-4(3H)-pyrimidinone 5'-phosphate reductase [Salarchaeum sp. JOR-1]